MNEVLYTSLLLILFLSLFITSILLLLTIIRIFSWLRRKKDFPKKLVYLLLPFLLLSLSLFLNHYYNLNSLPEGVLNAVVESPDGMNRIETYHFTGIYGANAKAVLVDQESGKRSTIYFNWYDYDPEVTWLNNRQVKIGRETLDIYDETYDYRRNKNVESLPPQRD